ncbi:MAG: hypothetical protein H7Z72_15245 [Bacteroidetes bacterium]|nr:hypothetical protein [Fibrella sp.]
MNIQKTTAFGLLAVLAVSAVSCQQSVQTDTAPVPQTASSFALLQQKVLTPNCATAGCHAAASDASFNQHGLVLAASVAYQNLVGIAPKNTNAVTDGLLRVKAFASLQSLLYHKLNAGNIHHTGKSYGNLMPLGSNPLSAGQVEFVRRWIEAGAPREGNVADAKLLDDTTPSVTPTAFEPLPAPAAGTGFQLTTARFDVNPNFEREIFVRRPIGNTEAVYVNRYEIKMRTNSHHLVAYSFRDNSLLPSLNVIRDLRNPDNSLNPLTLLSMSNHVYMAGTQEPYQNYVFPEGAAMLIPANLTVDLNSHYVNKTTGIINGEAYMNLYTVPAARVVNVVKPLDLGNQSLNIPPNSRVTLTKSFTFDQPRKILTLTSHCHKMGEKFVIRIKGGPRDGEIIYTSTDWEHPEIITYTTPITLQKGEGLTSEITYNNTTGKTINFGLTSEDEMGIIFGYYYDAK